MARKETMIQRSRAVSSGDKALWHDELGAGKNQVKRPFFRLNNKDEERILTLISQHLDKVTK